MHTYVFIFTSTEAHTGPQKEEMEHVEVDWEGDEEPSELHHRPVAVSTPPPIDFIHDPVGSISRE